DPSLAPEAYETAPVDFLVRGEGERPFCALVRALEGGRGAADDENRERRAGIPGLSFRDGDRFVHNAPPPAMALASETLRLPNRAARVLRGYTLLGRRVDVVETSRGCTFDCSFCSI